jgi:16S rRNA (adenine1518-N6/adenine1519-N6)-dimethyltransferase
VTPGRTPDGLPPALKRLGQHFLTDTRVLDRIVEALALTGSETVVEIGPGRAALTDRLVPLSARLIAVEIDAQLASWLTARFTDQPHVRVVHADVLETPLGSLMDGEYVLAGNVPYYITTPILFHALKTPQPRRAVYLVQKEVADRACATAGSSEYGALSVNLQVHAHIERLHIVKPGAFSPPPSVDSALMRVTPLAEPLVTQAESEPFAEFVRAMFGFRRSCFRRALRSATGMPAPQVDTVLASTGMLPDVRAETLSPVAFVTLFRAIRLPAAS